MPMFGTPGERVAFEAQGSGPPLLLLHGFTASSASFLSNIPELAERFTVISVDLLGHGASDAPESLDPYLPDPAVDRLVGLLDHLGHQQVLLCGHSLGGALALRFALDYPARSAGLIVINSNSAAGPPEWRETAQRGLEAMAARARAEGTGFLRESRLYPARSGRLPLAARDALVRDFDHLTPAGIAGTAEGLAARVNAWERLPELEIPTLVVIGDRDAEFVKNVDAFVARIAEDLVVTATLEGAGHAANLERPDEFHRAVFDFADALGYLPDVVLEPEVRRRRSLPLATLAGAALIAVGFSLLAAAALVDSDADPQAAPSSGDTAGNRIEGDSEPTATTAVAPIVEPTASPETEGEPTVSAPTPTPATTEDGGNPVAPQPTPTPTDTATTAPPATSTPVPPTAVPTPTVDPGPIASISGPASLGVGQPGTYTNASTVPNVITQTWSANGQAYPHEQAITVSFPAEGCYSVSLTLLFAGGAELSTSRTVSVGGASCS